MRRTGRITARLAFTAIFFASVCAIPGPALAGVIAYDFSGGNQAGGGGGPYGYEFTPVGDIVVDAVGYYDFESDGLAVDHTVSIWSIGGSLLSTTTVTTANSALAGPVVNDGQFRYTTIADLALSAGSTYIIVATAAGDDDVWWINGTHITDPPGLITIGANRFGTPGFPDSISATVYHHVSLMASAVPEPGVLAAFGLGLAGLALAQRRKRA